MTWRQITISPTNEEVERIAASTFGYNRVAKQKDMVIVKNLTDADVRTAKTFFPEVGVKINEIH